MTRKLNYVLDEIPFKVKFKHASFERESSSTLWVSLHSELGHGLGEACPRKYVTGETTESIQRFFSDPRALLFANAVEFEEFQSLLQQERPWIDENPSAFCALELAWWDLFAKTKDISVDKAFGDVSTPRQNPNTMVIGLGSAGKILKNYLRGLAMGFHDFKIKISPESKGEVLKFLNHPLFVTSKIFKPKIRLDANNSFATYKELQNLLDASASPIWAVEEPFAVANHEAREEFLSKSKSLLILDESLIKLADLKGFEHVYLNICLNIRISKLGGLLRSQEIIDFAKLHGIRWGLGCQVGETSLLARAGLLLIEKNLYRPLFWEGAFSDYLLTEDPFTPKIKVRPWGMISGKDQLLDNGWGLVGHSDYFKKVGLR